MTAMIRVVIADDHAFVRRGLRQVLDAEEGFDVVAEAADLESARRYTRGHRPDVLVLDLNMPGATGVEVLKVIRVCRPQLKVLVISGHITPEAHAELAQLGQRDFVQKPYRLDEVGRHIRRILETSAPPKP